MPALLPFIRRLLFSKARPAIESSKLPNNNVCCLFPVVTLYQEKV
jgi:hypothetical protein